MSIFSDIKDDQDRRQVMAHWAERYAQAKPIMTPDNDNLLDRFPKCGDAGLRLPAVKGGAGTEPLSERHSNIRSAMQTASPQDIERLELTLATENAAVAWHRDRKDRASELAFAEQLGKLVEHDREMGHPVADQTRDLDVHPVTAGEQAAWMLRDGRELNSEEQHYQADAGIYAARSAGEHHKLNPPGMKGEWFRPGPNAVMPQSLPDPRPSLDPEGPKMATFQALTQQPQLSIGEGVKERLAARRGLAM
ncbi:hypothetical protein [Xanthomonas sp. NCPPB 2632]|uniref:hypothetical protein n=1 Tax=Xanthomonas sp. NCPPB 2632 TaxID=3240912 RepID=UPI003512C9BF